MPYTSRVWSYAQRTRALAHEVCPAPAGQRNHLSCKRFFLGVASDRTPRVSSGPAWAARERTPADLPESRAVRPVSEGPGKSLHSWVVVSGCSDE